jgi:hypothetical protein
MYFKKYFQENTVSPEELINDFGIVFVEGAIYKDEFGNFWECATTGNYAVADCYELNKNWERIDETSYPMREADFTEFVGFAERLGEGLAA